MFVAFVDNPCPLIYIPTNVYKSICLILIKIIPNLLPTKFWLPMNIDPHKQKRFHSNSISVYPVLINIETINIAKGHEHDQKNKTQCQIKVNVDNWVKDNLCTAFHCISINPKSKSFCHLCNY